MPPADDEVYFCAQCKRQYAPEWKNEKCPICGKRTVSWYLSRESHEQAIEKWEYINGPVRR